MKTIGLTNSFLFIFLRRIVQDFLALFRFTEADTYALLSANGIYAFRGSSPAEQPPEQAKADERTLGGSKPLQAPRHEAPGPIPIVSFQISPGQIGRSVREIKSLAHAKSRTNFRSGVKQRFLPVRITRRSS